MEVLAKAWRAQGVRWAVAATAMIELTGCYSPSLSECVVACASPGDCGPGQVCGDDGWCASGGRAGACVTATVDAGPDAGGLPMSELRVVLLGVGRVDVGAPIRATCVASVPAGNQCSYAVPRAGTLVLSELVGRGWQFSGWDAPGCTSGKARTCSVVIGAVATTVTATFTSKD